MNTTQPSNSKLTIFILFLAFTLFGISENIKGPALPFIQEAYQINELQIGTLLSINSFGFLIACIFASYLVSKIEVKAVLTISLIVMALAGVCIFLSNNYFQFSASFFFMYLGNGLLEIVLSVMAARMFQQNTVLMMSLCHFFFGVGSTIGPIGASSIMGAEFGGASVGWQGMHVIILSLSAIPLMLTIAARFPRESQNAERQLSYKQHVRDPILWLPISIITLGVIVELSIAGWLVNLMEKSYGWASTPASYLLGAFFLLFTIGRLALSPWIEKIGYAKSMVYLATLCGVCTIVGATMGSPFVFLLALAGLGVAPLYPTVMAFVPKLYAGNTDKVVNFIIIVYGLGTTAGNLAVGGLTNAFKDWAVSLYGPTRGLAVGLELGFVFIGALALLCAFMSWVLMRKLPLRSTLKQD